MAARVVAEFALPHPGEDFLPVVSPGVYVGPQTSEGRRARTGDYLVAGWNTAAQVHNTYQALSAIPDAGVGVVLAALLAGVGTTYTILQSRRRAVAASAYREALAA